MSDIIGGIILIDFSLNQDFFCGILVTFSSAAFLGVWIRKDTL